MSYLHTDGRWIRNADDQEVRLRGVNTFVRQQHERAKYEGIKAIGANVVRLMFSAYDTVNPAWLVGMDQDIAWCQELGLMVLLDVHVDLMGFDGIGGSIKNVLYDETTQAQVVEMWKMLANRYKTNDAVIGIDILNEPWSSATVNPSNPTADRRPWWMTYARRVVPEILAINPDLLCIVSGWRMSEAAIAVADVSFYQGQNIVYTDHVYYPDGATSWWTGYRDGDREAGRAGLVGYSQARWGRYAEQDIAVFVGEIGFETSVAMWAEEMEDELAVLESLQLNYALFAYGLGTWASTYDIVSGNSAYVLTQVGIKYSDYIKSMEENMAVKTIPFTLAVTAAPDFFPAIAPTSLSVVKGVVAVYNVTVTGAGGFTGPVALAVLGLPVGAVGTFDKTSINVGETSVLSITTSSVAIGSYSPSIEATANI